MVTLLKKLGLVSRLFGEKVEKYQEAVTYAEAGFQDDAQRLFQSDQGNEEEGKSKLLVLSRESRFSEDSIAYALDMAQRLSYEILALSSAPLSSETIDLAFSRSKVCSEFQKLAEENVKSFKERAEELSIPFTHVVKFRDKDSAVEEITREFKDVEFVISDTEDERPVERVSQDNRPRPRMYVYSMLR